MGQTAKVGLGGGCHWCTEAVFQALKGVVRVDQGYIASTGESHSFSEGVIVHYDPGVISLPTLIEIHLHTHKSTSGHSFREKYRSAVYFLNLEDQRRSEAALQILQKDFEKPLITKVLPFREFKASRESLQNYYLKGPDKPFCRRYIHPKINLLKKKFTEESS